MGLVNSPLISVTYKDQNWTKAIFDLPASHNKHSFLIKFGREHPLQVQNILRELWILMLWSGAVLISKSLFQPVSDYESHQGNTDINSEDPQVASCKAAQNVPTSFLCPAIGCWAMQLLWIWKVPQWIYVMYLSHCTDEHSGIDVTIDSRTAVTLKELLFLTGRQVWPKTLAFV